MDSIYKHMVFAVFNFMLVSNAKAAISITGDVTDSNSTFTLAITNPISFTMIGSGARLILFDEWVASDGNFNALFDSPDGQSVSFRVSFGNGISNQVLPISSFIDNSGGSFRDITANDGYVIFTSSISAQAGDTVTILPQSFTFGGDVNFNPNLSGSIFTGNAFLADGSNFRVSSIESVVAVPESSTYVIVMGLSVFSLVYSLRRR